ncbi:precorrin-3B synthase [Pseudomonas sp. 21LCFQ02]|uniref:precorrin-3B synthase n=1 Tax=Pseudomonas sp. 21LCFQ02 TaxID=2957505 RepID=UPI00209B23EF|nr:precorrin-3B synthase [Pseudomonas sp. 21LCFQ02]MCO8170962.1 precorrin-3B synthase [Pseudomonas sp. 21LCFQ02]
MNEPQSARPCFVTPRPSACPGLLRIVAARDGGICRIKLAGGVLSAAQAQAVARAAQTYAQGVIEVTNRANLQIRGIGAEHQALIGELLGAGLGPANPASDDVRNLMLSPSAGLDPQMLCDTRPLAAQILASLENMPHLHALSPKFAVSLDGGEGLAMLEHPHDLWLSALRLDGQVWLGFGLAGCPAHDAPLAAVALEHGHALVIAVLELFLDLARPEQARMRHLLQDVPAAELLGQLQARLPVQWRQVSGWQRPTREAYRHLGIYPQVQDGLVAVGAAPALGRLDSCLLGAVAQLAEQLGDGSLHLTPWQSLLLPNVPASNAGSVLDALQGLGLTVSAEQPLARLMACTGSQGCAKGLADTKGDALALAAQLPADTALHLTGCQRSCAAAHVAPLTLLAVAPGHYDLYQRNAQHPGFGVLRARNLTIEAVGALLAADTRSTLHD